MFDNFAKNSLPSLDLQPDYTFLDLPEFTRSKNLNCVERLLDEHVQKDKGDNVCIRTFDEVWAYRDLYEKANQIAHVLVEDLGLQSGNRVLLRSCNNPMMVACWYAILKAGGIVVATMPLLRSKELKTLINCAEISHVLCDADLADEMNLVQSEFLKTSCFFGNGDLENKMASKPKTFQNYNTKADDVAIIGFTSGTTGNPKMTAHFHKDILNICEAFPNYSLQPTENDIFKGSTPIGVTFGLCCLDLFPMYFGASSFLIEKPSPDVLLEVIQNEKITICFTAPTAWRILTEKSKDYDLSSLRRCISAGETLPLKIWEDWYKATGLKIIDGIGATE